MPDIKKYFYSELHVNGKIFLVQPNSGCKFIDISRVPSCQHDTPSYKLREYVAHNVDYNTRLLAVMKEPADPMGDLVTKFKLFQERQNFYLPSGPVTNFSNIYNGSNVLASSLKPDVKLDRVVSSSVNLNNALTNDITVKLESIIANDDILIPQKLGVFFGIVNSQDKAWKKDLEPVLSDYLSGKLFRCNSLSLPVLNNWAEDLQNGFPVVAGLSYIVLGREELNGKDNEILYKFLNLIQDNQLLIAAQSSFFLIPFIKGLYTASTLLEASDYLHSFKLRQFLIPGSSVRDISMFARHYKELFLLGTPYTRKLLLLHIVGVAKDGVFFFVILPALKAQVCNAINEYLSLKGIAADMRNSGGEVAKNTGRLANQAESTGQYVNRILKKFTFFSMPNATRPPFSFNVGCYNIVVQGFIIK